jgi:hypothetical protein
MKTVLGLASAFALLGGLGVAQAGEPVALTAAEMDKVAAGQTTIFIPAADSASISAADDAFLGASTANTDDLGNTATAVAAFFSDGIGSVAVDDPRGVLVTLN